jgi:hypothetical protein
MVEKTGNEKPDQSEHELSEELFEQYIDGDSSLTEAYRELEQAEPSLALDRTILDEARKERQPQRKSLLDLDMAFWRQWAKPLSTAVIMGVCLTVVLRILDYETLAPTASQDLELASIEHDRLFQEETADSPAALSVAGTPPLSSTRQAKKLAPTVALEQKNAPPAQAAREKSAATENYARMEEVTITARKRSESLQEVPLAVAGLQSEEVIIDSLQSQDTARIIARADNALEAWDQGARPAVDVWQAGIDAVYAVNETAGNAAAERYDASHEQAKMAQIYPDENKRDTERDDANREQEKMAQVYPDETRGDTARKELMADMAAEPNSKFMHSDIIEAEAQKTRAVRTPDDGLADPFVWAAGIEWLFANERAQEAGAELEKFRQIYPYFKVF